MYNSQNDRPTSSPLTDRLARTRQVRELEAAKAMNERMIQSKMWSRQGSIFQETALIALDQPGSKAHKAIGIMVNRLNALGEISQDEVTRVVKAAMVEWSALLWTD